MGPATSGARPPDLGSVLDSILSPLAMVDRELRLVAVNRAYCDAGGRTRGQLIGVRLIDAFPENPDDDLDTGPADLRDSLLRVLDSGQAEVLPLQRYDVQPAEGGPFVQRYWSITTSPVPGGPDGRIDFAVVHAEEVTSYIDERLRLEVAGQLPSTAGQTDAVATVFTEALRRSQALNDFAEALVRSSTLADVAAAFLGAGIAFVGGCGGSLVRVVGRDLSTVGRVGLVGNDDEWLRFPLAPGQDPFSDAVLGGEPLLFANRAEILAAYPALRDAIEPTTNHAWAVVPIFDGTRHAAALGVAFSDPDVFTPLLRLDLENLSTLTSQALSRATLVAEQAEAIDSITLVLEADLDAPSTVATSILYRPAATLSRAGGDWFDVITTSDTRTVMAVGDVAAHGAGTTGEMLRARAALQSHALQGEPPSEIATKVSASVARFSETFATACIAVYDAADGMLAWTTAGHPYPLLIDAAGNVELLAETHGPPLGVARPGGGYGHASRRVRPSDTLVLYTDGLIERRTEHLDDSFRRLVEAARAAPGPRQLADHLYASLLPDGPHTDDVAILVATFQPAVTASTAISP